MTTTAQSIPQLPWAADATEEIDEPDEPPEAIQDRPSPQNFGRTAIKRPNDQSSLLTKAIMGHGDEEAGETFSTFVDIRRRRSINSNVSVASTADLTSDTGLTSPARTNTPSPPIPDIAVLRLNGHPMESQKHSSSDDGVSVKGAEVSKEGTRKRCIQFACTSRPAQQEAAPLRPVPMQKAPSAIEAPRRPCIRFACSNRPASTQNTPPKVTERPVPSSTVANQTGSPSTPKRLSAVSAMPTTSPSRPSSSRRTPTQALARPKFLRATSKDLVNDASQFHEFASGVTREEDWIRTQSPARGRLTIDDTLSKENVIRRLATEAEEEAELEEEAEEAALDDDDDDADELDEDGDDDEDDEADSDEEDEEDDDDDDDDEDDSVELYSDSDGYHTDEETGFAESDSEDDGDENMILWTPGRLAAPAAVMSDVTIPAMRAPPAQDQQSDSSTSRSNTGSVRRSRMTRVRPQTEAADLPDSTDFVCGTLDEDRPLEEAYLSCLAARRSEKLRVIPQDIDPSFPASDPEDVDEEDVYNPVHHESDEDHFMHGKMEDLDVDQDRSRRRRKSEQHSPRKYHSPPPKRRASPAPKAKRLHSPPPKTRTRCRSPKPTTDRTSPRRPRSPAPHTDQSTPTGSLHYGGQAGYHVRGNPALMQTKSLPRPAAVFAHLRNGRHAKAQQSDDIHVRGAIDIVKGLEKKRQRRKEKFQQKYCNRARRGQIPERKPQPGKGAERMKELGLLMAGKKNQGDYIISV